MGGGGQGDAGGGGKTEVNAERRALGDAVLRRLPNPNLRLVNDVRDRRPLEHVDGHSLSTAGKR